MPKFYFSIFFFFLHFAASGQPKQHFFHVLYEPKDALQCRIDLVQQAKKEILLSYYIIKDDLSGSVLLNLLAEASSKRGVIVQILMDGNGSKISEPMQDFLKKNGVVFHRFFLKRKGLKKYYHGLHEKIFMVDNQFLIVGGRNIKDNYFDLGPDFNFFDYDVLATGDTLLHDARLHFYTLWHNEKLSSPYPAREISQNEVAENLQKIQFATAEVQRKLQIKFNTGTNWLANCTPTSAPAGFINDDFHTKKGRHYYPSDEKKSVSTSQLVQFIDSAKTSIFIENPYFVPTKIWKRALGDALRRGVKVRLMTNSIRTNDLPIRQAAYLNLRKKLLRQGLEIWELQGDEKLHAKAMVVDEEVVAIGSYNIHRPSERYNTEVAVWIKNKNTAQTQLKVMDNNLEKAQQIGKNNRPIHRIDKNFKRPSFGLRTKVFLLRYTVAQIFGWLM